MEILRIIILLSLIIFIVISQEPSIKASLDEKRKYMLGLMNTVRAQQNIGLGSLTLDATLNTVAQGHSADMIKRNFFSHTNPDGLGPGERARKVGFTARVGENIAMGQTLTQMHKNLMNSPGHFNNTINKDWTRTGVGIQYDKNNNIYVTIMFSIRDFSANPVSTTELQNFTTQFKSVLKALNPSLKTQDTILSTHLQKWLAAGRSPSSFFTYLSTIAKYNPGGSMDYRMYQSEWSPNLANQIKNQQIFKLTKPNYTKYGAGANVDKSGTTYVAVVFVSV